MADPIFVVGAPRSGTTLLAAMLGAHSRISCGPETQLFSKRRPKGLAEAAGDDRWPQRAVELISTLSVADQRVIDLFGIDENELWDALARREPSVAAMLESLTATLAAREGKPRWAEKTPNHILHLAAIRRAWPQARVVRIVRDPRDSAASMRKLPAASDSTLANALLWAEWHGASRAFFATDEWAFTVRYEDLIRDPEARLRELCDFVEEDYEPAMLDTSASGRAVASEGETWKAGVAGPIDPNREAQWRTALPADVARAVSYLCVEGIADFGYEPGAPPSGTVAVHPLDRRSIEANERALIEICAAGTRIAAAADPWREPRLLLLPPPPGAGARADLGRLALLAARRARGRETLRPDR